MKRLIRLIKALFWGILATASNDPESYLENDNMNAIWKFEFTIQHYFVIEMPKDAEILDIQFQRSVPCIWAAVNTEAPMEKRKFRLYGTGHEITSIKGYIATIQELSFVWHVFEEVE